MFFLSDQDSLYPDSSGIISDKYITVHAAANLTGYNSQYLRRLLRNGRLDGIRVGQAWLIQLSSLDVYLESMTGKSDRRCGSKNISSKKTEQRQVPSKQRKNTNASTNVNVTCLRLFTDVNDDH